MGVVSFVFMAKADDARFQYLNVSNAESAVCAPLNLRRRVFLHGVRQLSEVRISRSCCSRRILRCDARCVLERNTGSQTADG